MIRYGAALLGAELFRKSIPINPSSDAARLIGWISVFYTGF